MGVTSLYLDESYAIVVDNQWNVFGTMLQKLFHW